jgi:hypothetical protein
MDARLVVAKGKTTVREIPLGGPNTIIGRRTDCGLRIPSPLVSRQHCEIKCSGNRLVVRDLGSSNGTFVNGSKVKQKELKSGDTLGVGPITFIIQLGDAPISPSDTARPVAAAAADDDVADFVVAEEVETAEDADFVVAEPAGDSDDVADFVVAGESADDEAADFVVAEATDDTEIGDVADFVPSEEPATEADADFVVADAADDEGDTVQNMTVADVKAKQKEKKPAADAEPAEPEKPKEKKGLFGRFFKRKEKKPAAAEAVEPEPAPEEKASKPSRKAAKPDAAAAAAAAAPAAAEFAESADDEMADMFVTEDDDTATPAKPVGDDELADFLMGLNEKEE